MKDNQDDLVSGFIKKMNPKSLARQIQSFIKGGDAGLFNEKKVKTEADYKNDIIELLKERKRNGL